MRVRSCLPALAILAGLVAGPATAQNQFVKADGPRLDLGDYDVTFEDDFTKADVVGHGPFSAHAPGMRWIAHTPWNGDFGDARFADPGATSPFAFGPDGLTITASKAADGTWRSGLICSVDRDGAGQQGFSQRYGYFEMRAKLPDGSGVWPAFWLVGTDKSNGSAEIDVLEYYGKFPAGYHTTTHLWKAGAGVIEHRVVEVPEHSLTTKFHDYGVLIRPDRMTFYLDRTSYLDVPTPPAYKQPFYIIADLALGGAWPIDGLASPARMQITYIRVYRERNGPL